MSFAVISILALIVSGMALMRAYSDRALYKQRLQQLEREVERARRQLRQRGELANELAHEIKNPLTAIVCSAETLHLILGPTLDETNRTSLQYIKEYGENLLRLVSDFLDVSRLEQGPIRALPEAVDVVRTGEVVVGLLRSSAMAKQIAVRQRSTEPTLFAYVDPRHVKQILFNLLHNAIKFTPERGEIRLELFDDFPKHGVRIQVTDNGPGIPQAMIPVLFDPYARREHRTPESGEGLGLGLALTRHLVERAGGTISVSSTPGQGTRFEVALPSFTGKCEAVEAASEQPGRRPLAGQSILVAQPAGAPDVVGRLLEAWGGMVARVEDAEAAVTALRKGHFSAVVVDDAVCNQGLLRAVKSELPTRAAPPVVVLGSAPSSNEALQPVVVVEKPLSGKALLSAIEGLRPKTS